MAQTPDPFLDMLEKARVGLQRFAIASEVMEEAKRGSDLHDNSHLKDGTGKGTGKDVVRDLHSRILLRLASMADIARERCQDASHTDDDSWERVLIEEIFEALEEQPGSRALRGELVQSAAVILNWIAAIDDRATEAAKADIDEEN